MHKGNLYNLIISYLGLILGLVNNIFRAKAITTEEYGLFAVIITIAGIIQYFTVLGIPNIILRFYPTFESKEQRNGFLTFFTGVILTTIILVSIIFIAVKPYVLRLYDNNEQLSAFYYCIVLIVVANSLMSLFDMISRVTYKSIVSSMIRNIFFKILHFVLLFVIYLWGLSYSIYIDFFVLLSFITSILMLLNVRQDLHMNRLSFDFINFGNIKEWLKYGSFMLVSIISGGLVYQIDKLMIGSYSNFTEVGIYNLSMIFASSLALIPASFSRITLSEVSNAFNRNNFDEINRIYKHNLEQQIYYGIMIFISIILFSDDLLKIFGKDYQSGSLVLIFLSTGFLINLSVGMSGEIIALSKHYKFDLYSKLFLLAISISLNSIFIPRFGIEGASLATLITLFLYGLLKIFYTFKKMNILPYKLSNLSYLVSGFIAYLTVLIIKQIYHHNSFLLIILPFTTYLIYDLILAYAFKDNSTILSKLLHIKYKSLWN